MARLPKRHIPGSRSTPGDSIVDRRPFLARTLAACLTTCLVTQATLLHSASPDSLHGTVSAAGSPLSDVLVSDGFCVTRTNEEGRYHIPLSNNSGRFIFVSAPRGYWTDAFYRSISQVRVTGPVDFELAAVDQSDRFDFVFLTDVHLERKEFSESKFKASLTEIAQLDPTPALLWVQGDICLQGGMGTIYQQCLATSRLPIRNGAGNHEMILEDANPRAQFEEMFGPTYYSFDWGPIHCIVLDGNKPIPGQEGWKAVHGAVEGSELAWLEADLAAQPSEKPIVVGVHIPIVSTYPERRAHSPEDAPYWEMTNHCHLTDLFTRYGVRLVLQGHMHENERISVGGVEYVESNAVSGTWWKSGQGFERGVDGSPRGYRIVSVEGNRITHRFRTSCESYVDRQGEFRGGERPIRREEHTNFVFNCYDAPNGSTARARIDGGVWQPMPAFEAVNKEFELVMPHHFRLQVDARRFPAGLHHVEAEVTWPDGTLVREQTDFSLFDE